MSPRQQSTLLGLLFFFALAAGSVFTVAEWEKVVVVRLGKVLISNSTPGLHFKLPIVDTLHRFDGRTLTLDSKAEQLRSKDGQDLVADLLISWRINDLDRYYRASGGDEEKAFTRIRQSVHNSVSSEIATYTTVQAIAGVSRERTRALVAGAGQQLKELGLEVIDVQFERLDLPDSMTLSLYDRMQTERRSAAAEQRARGDAEAMRTRAEADRQRDEIIAAGNTQADEIRADGDAQAGEIYGQAYAKNPEFYSFYRSLGVYQNSLRSKGDVLVLEPDGELFKYFNPPASPR